MDCDAAGSDACSPRLPDSITLEEEAWEELTIGEGCETSLKVVGLLDELRSTGSWPRTAEFLAEDDTLAPCRVMGVETNGVVATDEVLNFDGSWPRKGLARPELNAISPPRPEDSCSKL